MSIAESNRKHDILSDFGNPHTETSFSSKRRQRETGDPKDVIIPISTLRVSLRFTDDRSKDNGNVGSRKIT